MTERQAPADSNMIWIKVKCILLELYNLDLMPMLLQTSEAGSMLGPSVHVCHPSLRTLCDMMTALEMITNADTAHLSSSMCLKPSLH